MDGKVKILPKFCLDHVIAGIQQLQCYHKWIKTKENLLMNIANQYGEKRKDFAEVTAFFHMTCRYFDRFLLQGVDINCVKPGFFDPVWIVGMHVCVCVCLCPRLLITSGVMWHDMDLIRLDKKVLQLVYGNCRHYRPWHYYGLGINTRNGN